MSLRRSGTALAAVGLIVGSLALSREPLLALAIIFVIVVPFEKWMPRHRQSVRRPRLGTDIAHAIVAPVVAPIGLFVGAVIGIVSFGWLPGLAVRPLVTLLPGWASLIVGFLLFDILVYWTHRFSHEIPLLWRFHSVHHSTETLDWVSGFRQHPFDGIILAPAFAFLLGAGFSGEYAGVLAVLQIVTGLFLHANVRWRLRPLHRLIITPEFHHWHHTNEPMAIHSNYSVFLPVWDLAFGTYFMPSNRRPKVYGIDEPMPDTLVGQLLWPFRGMDNPARVMWRALRHPIRSMRWCWGWVRFLCSSMARSARRPTRNLSGNVPLPPVKPAGSQRKEPARPAAMV